MPERRSGHQQHQVCKLRDTKRHMWELQPWRMQQHSGSLSCSGGNYKLIHYRLLICQLILMFCWYCYWDLCRPVLGWAAAVFQCHQITLEIHAQGSQKALRLKLHVHDMSDKYLFVGSKINWRRWNLLCVGKQAKRNKCSHAGQKE